MITYIIGIIIAVTIGCILTIWQPDSDNSDSNILAFNVWNYLNSIDNRHRNCQKYSESRPAPRQRRSMNTTSIPMPTIQEETQLDAIDKTYQIKANIKAAMAGDLSQLKIFKQMGYALNADVCMYAAMSNQQNALQWLHDNECPWDDRVCIYAAAFGNLDCLKYAHENGCAWDARTCMHAAGNGHKDCLEYAHSNGCTWDGNSYQWAAAYGKIDILEYLLANKCPYNKHAFVDAVENGQVNVLTWLKQHRNVLYELCA